jgi:hypothetical protein
MKITKSNERECSFIRALVHGDSGIGKTTSLRTLPEAETLIVAAERGLLPLRKRSYDVVIVSDWTDCDSIVQQLAAGEFHDKRIVAFDSLTEIAELCKRQIVGVDRRALISDRTKGKTNAPTGIYADLLAQEDWGLYGARMSNWLAATVHLPRHVVMTALSSVNENKQTGAQLKTPDLNGKLAFECPAYFDLVCYMHAAKDSEGVDIRAFRTSNNGMVLAKDASGELPEVVAANWTHVFKMMLGKGETK